MTIREIASFLQGEIVGDEKREITGVAKIEEAKAGEITFLSNPKYERFLETTGASAVIVGRALDLSRLSGRRPTFVRVEDPYTSFVLVVQKFSPQPPVLLPGIHPTAVIDPTARLGKNCAVGPHVVVGPRAVVGDDTILLAGTVLGTGVTIGDRCILYANVTVCDACVVGNRVIVQPGAVIGGDGFGFAPQKDGTYRKIPQLGIVVIEDDVEIGANTCIDRATLGETRVGKGTKLDNLVQVAHNVTVGKNVVIAGSSGIAGSTKIGDGVMMGGHVAINGHITVANKVAIGGHSGVTKSIQQEGAIYFGFPAKEVSKARRIEGALRQLPELLATIRDLESRLQSLEKTLAALKK